MNEINGNFEMQEVDLEKKVNEVAVKVKASPEVQKLATQLDIRNAQAIMSFGQDTAVEISKFSDRILASISNSSVEDSGKMLQQLNSIMGKFDKKDFEDKKPGLFEKIFNKVKDDINKLLEKYQTMDKEISKIYVEIKQYENEITKTNNMLEEMFEKNLEYYENLEKYIQAGYIITDNMRTQIIPQLEQRAASGDQMEAINLQNGLQALEMVEQRVYDLEMAKMVALQTAPQIKLIQRGNYNLLRKIGSAFVVTIPVFKSGLIQAIAIKRQKIQADAMKALDDKTNEMLMRNAQNIASQSVDIARLTSGSSIKIETLEKTFETIVRGIEETKQIEEENRQNRDASRQKLLELQHQLESKR
ncbi:toxic anion resistance protein [Alkaliphilus sp. B6464]|uniref:toxic anion resistance protein n=1 Tax=Alkaliphilus sp. B6464 TaxID=2731219 RepID=UPI001BA5157B|nr:toxic anion resistance protein [Alkaliphilus sp. B6464]QUH18536.1 toxic anion resistance protein [Alkaliphilus sp. B6464]